MEGEPVENLQGHGNALASKLFVATPSPILTQFFKTKPIILELHKQLDRFFEPRCNDGRICEELLLLTNRLTGFKLVGI